MNKLLSITWKDLLQTIREWKALFFMLIMPVLFTLFFGLVFTTEEGGAAGDVQSSMEKLPQGRYFSIQTIPVSGAAAQPLPGGFSQSSPGMIIQFTILGLISTAMVLLYERKSKTMGRMIATPIRFAGIIAGHTLAMFIAVYIQQLILVVVGQIIFKVPYFSNPGPLFLLLFFFALWATSLGVLISTFAKKEEQVVTLAIICMFIFSAFGGAWFPLEVAGPAFSRIGHVLPSAWVMDGLQDIILRGKGFNALRYPLLITAAYTVVFFAAATIRLRRLRA